MPDPVAETTETPVTTPVSNPSTAQTLQERAKTLPERLPWYGWLGVGVVSCLLIGKVLR